MTDTEETQMLGHKRSLESGAPALSRKEAKWNVMRRPTNRKQEPIDTLKNTYGHRYRRHPVLSL